MLSPTMTTQNRHGHRGGKPRRKRVRCIPHPSFLLVEAELPVLHPRSLLSEACNRHGRCDGKSRRKRARCILRTNPLSLSKLSCLCCTPRLLLSEAHNRDGHRAGRSIRKRAKYIHHPSFLSSKLRCPLVLWNFHLFFEAAFWLAGCVSTWSDDSSNNNTTFSPSISLACIFRLHFQF
jgi:hypothetical protein